MALRRLIIPLRLRTNPARPTPVTALVELGELARDLLPPGHHLDLSRLALLAGPNRTAVPVQCLPVEDAVPGPPQRVALSWIAADPGEHLLAVDLTEVNGIASATALARPTAFPRVAFVPEVGGRLAGTIDGAPALTYHYDPGAEKPFLHPFIGPAGVALTRLGHPPDHEGRRHQNAIWIGHRQINRVNFWDDQASHGRQRHAAIRELTDGPVHAALTAQIRWESPRDELLLTEDRTLRLWSLPDGEKALDLELTYHAVEQPIEFGRTPFGLLGVRVARSMSVLYGGGRIEAATGGTDEDDILHTRARWCDYSGPVTPETWNGIAVFDHAGNPHHPCFWQVRDDGWFGAALCYDGELRLAPGESLQVRYRLLAHAGDGREAGLDQRYGDYVETPSVEVGPPAVRDAAELGDGARGRA